MTEQGNLMESTRYHPGTMVSEYLEFNEWTQRELARRTGLTPKTVNEICNGKARISPTTALAFERVFHRPAHFWLNLQTKFDEIEARQLAMDNLLSWREWANRFPIADMKRFRFLDVPSKDETSVTSALLFFFWSLVSGKLAIGMEDLPNCLPSNSEARDLQGGNFRMATRYRIRSQ